MSRKAGRPVRKPNSARMTIAALPIELAATSRSNTVGPLSARTSISVAATRTASIPAASISRRPSNAETRRSMSPLCEPGGGFLGQRMDDEVALVPRRVGLDGDGARRQRDRIGVGDDADGGLLGRPHGRAACGEIGRDGVRMIRDDVEGRNDDLLDQPRPVEEARQDQFDRMPFLVGIAEQPARTRRPGSRSARRRRAGRGPCARKGAARRRTAKWRG